MVQVVEPAHPFNEYQHDGKRLKGYNGHAYPSLPELNVFSHGKHTEEQREPPLNMHLSVIGNESGLPDPNGVPHASDLTSPIRSNSQSCRSHATAPCTHHNHMGAPQQQYAPPPQNQSIMHLQGSEKAPTSASETSQTSPLPLQLMPINTNNHHSVSPQFSVENNAQYSAPGNQSYGPSNGGSRDQMPVHGGGGSQGGWASQNQNMVPNRTPVSNVMPQQADRGYSSAGRSMSGVSSQGAGGLVKSGSMVGEPPCAACKSLRRKCTTDCLLLPFFPRSDPDKFAHVHKVFGASNVTKILQVR